MKNQKTKKITEPTDSFLMIDYKLLGSEKFTPNEKIFFAYLIGWQVRDAVCYQSTSQIAKKIGINIHTFKKMLTKCNNEYGKFFISEYPTDTTHVLKIDIEALNIILNEDTPKVKKEKSTSTPKEIAMEEFVEEFGEIITDDILEDEDEDDEEYEEIDEVETFTLMNGTKVIIRDEHKEVWKTISINEDVLDNLKYNKNQWLFELELNKYEK